MFAVILGKSYRLGDIDAALDTIPRFTYRKNIPEISTDRHWGCCIRCTQSMLSEYLMVLIKEFSDVYNSKFPPSVSFLNHFNDLPSAPFSIHSFCRELRILGTNPKADWVKPSIVAQVIRRLLAPFHLNTIVAEGSQISRDAVRSIEGSSPILVLVPLMLGMSTIDSSYEDFIYTCLSIPRTLGIIGGKGGKAYYFVGYSPGHLYYFDPHVTYDAVSSESSVNEFFKEKIKKMNIKDINSSLLFGFVARNLEDIENTIRILSQFGSCPFAVVDTLPSDSASEETDWVLIE